MGRIVIDSWDERLLGGPFLVIGVASRVPIPWEETPSLITIGHQAGGYACLQEELTGVVLRFSEAHPLATKPLGPLLNGLALIAESAPGTSGPIDRRVVSFGSTWGQPIDAQAVWSIVSEYLPIPPFDEGVEALLSGPLDDPRFFRRWPTWHPELGLHRLDETVCDHLVAAVAHSRQPLRAFLLWENSD